MTWRIEVSRSAERELGKLDRRVAGRIVSFLHHRIAVAENPRTLGSPLRGPELGRFWRYRVGDYRIICEFQEDRCVVLVLRVGHRKRVYR